MWGYPPQRSSPGFSHSARQISQPEKSCSVSESGTACFSVKPGTPAGTTAADTQQPLSCRKEIQNFCDLLLSPGKPGLSWPRLMPAEDLDTVMAHVLLGDESPQAGVEPRSLVATLRHRSVVTSLELHSAR